MSAEAWELTVRTRHATAQTQALRERETPEETRDRLAVESWLGDLETALDADTVAGTEATKAVTSAPARQFLAALRSVVRRVRRLSRIKFDSWAAEYGSPAESEQRREPDVDPPKRGRPRATSVPVSDYASARVRVKDSDDPRVIGAALLALFEEANPQRSGDVDKAVLADTLGLQRKPLPVVQRVFYWLMVSRDVILGNSNELLGKRANTGKLNLDVDADQIKNTDTALLGALRKIKLQTDVMSDRIADMATDTKRRLAIGRDVTRRGVTGAAVYEAVERAWTSALKIDYGLTPEQHLANLLQNKNIGSASDESSSSSSVKARVLSNAAPLGLVYSGGTGATADDTGADDDRGIMQFTPAQARFRDAVEVHDVNEKAFYSKLLSALTYGKAYLKLVTHCSEMLGDDADLIAHAPPLSVLPLVDPKRRVHPRDDQAHWLALSSDDKALTLPVVQRRWWWLRMVALFVRTEVLERRGPPGPTRYAIGELASFLASPVAFASEQRRNSRVTGPPGVGKTTFMQKLAVLYALLGVLPLGAVQSEDDNKVTVASDLTGQYEGETEQKTRVLLVRGIGQLVPIDEAYALVVGAAGRDRGGTAGGAYGRQALVQLVALANEFASLECIALLGYAHEIDRLIASNEGLTRRFPRLIDIRAYTASEMLDVFEALVVERFGSRDAAAPYLVAAGIWRERAVDVPPPGRGRRRAPEAPTVTDFERATDTPTVLNCLLFLTGELFQGTAGTESDGDETSESTSYLLARGEPVLTDTFTFVRGTRRLTVTRHEFVLQRGDESEREYAERAALQIAQGDIGNMLEQQNASGMGALLDRLVKKRLASAMAWTAGEICITLFELLEDAGLFERRSGERKL